MKKRIIFTVLVTIVVIGITYATALFSPESLVKQVYKGLLPLTPFNERRLLSNFTDRKSIKIGIPGPLDDMRATNLFIEGVELAVAEHNTSNTLPLPLEIEIADDKYKMTEVLSIASNFAENREIVAVFGHWGSEYSMAAANVYDNAGIIMITPASTTPDLTKKDFTFVFRNTSSDEKIGAYMAQYAQRRGYKNVVILYSKDLTGIHVANAFENEASELGVSVIDKHSIFFDLEAFGENYHRWQSKGMDAVFIADIITRNVPFQTMLIQLNPDLPILASDAYDFEAPLLQLSKLANNVNSASFFNPMNQHESYQEFCARFEETYGKSPDYWAVQGYNSVEILVQAILGAGSLDPVSISEFMKKEDVEFMGVDGSKIAFSSDGELLFDRLVVKQVFGGEIRYWRLDEVVSNE